MSEPTRRDKDDMLRKRLYAEAKKAKVYAPGDYPGKQVPIAQLRRSRPLPLSDMRMALTLVERDGVLRWEDSYGYSAPGRRAGLRGAVAPVGRIVAPINFERLEPSQVGEYLEKLDEQLTPRCSLTAPEKGLMELKNGTWTSPATPAAKGRILVFIHGTFSNNDAFLSELAKTKDGVALLGQLELKRNYDQVLGFDHATVSVSPVLNALDLGRLFDGSAADVDVITHSRGGLVTRWWLECFDRQPRNAVRALLVGSPLAGTSLAVPPRLRAGLDFLTNVGHVLELGAGAASAFLPFFTVASGLLRVITSITALSAKTPLIDAAVAMIPGLSAQSMVKNNEELLRLNQSSPRKIEYFAMRGDFRPEDPGWNFLKYFVGIGDRAKALGADLVFEGANDLVVDTGSMTVLSRKPNDVEIGRMHDFGTTTKVHHTVYFRQPETPLFIRSCFGIS